jgi:hypothetical protein
MSELTSDNVVEAFNDSLYGDSNTTPLDPIKVEGIVHTIVFNKTQLENHRDEVISWIDQLPPNFLKEGGGGWTFLNLCMRKDGVQWTGFHLIQEHLLTMAIALDLAQIQLPREMWSVLPGSVPYVVFWKE